MNDAAPQRRSSEFALHAWVDESMRVQAGIYLLAAVVCVAGDCDQHRDTLRSLLDAGQPKLHWRAESPKRRTKIIQTVSSFDMTSVVVIGTPMDKKKQERARAVCMESLAIHLASLEVTQVYLEERETRLNARDRKLIGSIRGKKLIPNSLRIDTAKPSVEPMLWLPDIVAGAVGQERVRGVSEYLDPLRPFVTELPVPVR